MGNGYIFGYAPGETWLHRADPRATMAMMAGIGIGAAGAGPLGLTVLTTVLLTAALWIHLPIRQMRSELRYLLLLWSIVALVRGCTSDGALLWEWQWIAVSKDGLGQGIVFGWRLVCIGVAAIVFVSVTRPSRMIAAVHWLLRPIPGLPAARVAIMVGMVVRFLPLVLDQARLNRDALAARGISARRNPISRLIWRTLPVLRRVILQADQLALAMVSRGYASNLPRQPLPRLGLRDQIVIGAAIGLAAILHFL